MKISYNWLKEYVNTQHSPERMAEILTSTGLEVEGLKKVEEITGGLEGVVVGKVVTCVPHENADKLKVTTVDVGGDSLLQIVCGAPNVEAGQKVVVATVGTKLYPNPDEPFSIKKAKIRGVESFGMICAEDELGLGNSHDGIIVLPEETPIGQKASDYFDVKEDYCIEIGLTPNRSDALGHLGVARDIVAFNKVHKVERSQLKFPDIGKYKVFPTNDKLWISVEEPEACPQYIGCVISDIKVEPSPDWLQKRLKAIGLSPINNIVDVTNFVMHELGTPLHAFDLRRIGDSIVVKNATEGEKFVTLDGAEHTLSASDLMITNGDKNLAIAGVFGGADSGISENTTSIFIEAAYFNPVSVRKTAKRLGINTDASFRFERGVDPEMINFAMKRAATLIVEITGGIVTNEPIPFYPKQITPNEVVFSYSRCNKLIGNDISTETINDILNALDIKIIHNNGDTLKLKIPTYRVDVTREADVVEEILRIYGFNSIEIPGKWNVSLSENDLRSEEKQMNAIADMLVSKGFYEMMNNSLSNSKLVEEFGGNTLKNDFSVSILNPLSEELDVMRQTLVFQGITSIAHNKNRQSHDLKLFEFGKVYQKREAEYLENKRLSLFMTGKNEPEQWNSQPKEMSFYSLKGIVTSIFSRLGLVDLLEEKPLEDSILNDGIQLFIQKFKVGELGWMSQKVTKKMGVKENVFIADLDWDMILSLANRNKVVYEPLPRTFAIRRDFSLLLNKQTTFAEIENIARKTDRKLLKNVGLFDVYEGNKLPENKKSYAVSFYFQDQEKTLQDAQIDQIMNKIQQNLEKEIQAELRS